IPEDSTIHATAWKVLLGYLPPDKNMWQKTIYDQRLSYYNLVKDLLERPTEEPPSNDHPLNVTPGSKWASYIHDNTILEQIDKDVKRTLPDFAFFQQHVPQNPLNPLSAPLPPTSTTSTTTTTTTIDNQQNNQSYDPLDDDDFLDPLQANDVKRRFSFGIMGRPRSGSNASRKSIKNNNSNSNNNNNNIVNRSRSNSKSSTRSFSTGMIENGADIIQSPRNLVRKISTAFSKSNSSLSLNTFATKKYQHHPQQQQKPALKPMCPYIPNRRSLFKRIQQQLNHDDHHHASSTNTSGKKENDKDDDDDDDHVQDYHWEVIERILFMYAKLNPGIGYVQGMNEILAPIYYVFANDTSTHLAGQVHAEADTFFSFSILMGEVRDHFVRSLDQDATTGIHATLLRMQQRLAWYDKSLWRDLQRKDIKEAYYAFRWITVLFTQEWDLPDVIRLWDSLLAERGMQDTILNNNNNMNQHHYGQPSIPPSTSFVNETPFEFLLDFSVAMLVCIRQELFKGDFAENVKLLQ
ncbi:rab-GTPase-TBC domain-containing protein, partial [Cunninghamella echinulata]